MPTIDAPAGNKSQKPLLSMSCKRRIAATVDNHQMAMLITKAMTWPISGMALKRDAMMPIATVAK